MYIYYSVQNKDGVLRVNLRVKPHVLNGVVYIYIHIYIYILGFKQSLDAHVMNVTCIVKSKVKP